MTSRGKFVLTLLILGVVAFGVARWWDKIAPASNNDSHSVNPDQFKEKMSAQATVESKLLAGDKAVSLVDGSAIPPVTGVANYDKTMKDGKLVVQFPIN
ncbi:MAG TPA: hypothetical protein VGO11_24465, partial [Chthoniobacteraceae bacterium]|nr:hypothetical protein [Chthoniobacteraceae bacterium]